MVYFPVPFITLASQKCPRLYMFYNSFPGHIETEKRESIFYRHILLNWFILY